MFDTPYAGTDTIIDAVEVLRLNGSFKSLPGVNRQYQGHPIHVYPELHPAPYSDNANAKETTSKITQYYVRIKTKGGLTGFYGAIDPETVPPLLNQLRPCL
jgi:hypothetical protein